MADAAIPENPFILNLMSSYGPILIGAIFQCVLYGMAVIQLFLYFNNYEKDTIWMKSYVLFIWVIETASTISVLVSMWPVMILRWGSLAELSKTQLPVLHRAWISGLGTFLVHMFFIYRIYMVSGRRWYPLVLIPFTVYQMVETWVYVITALRNPDLATLSGRFLTDLGTSGRSVIAFIDIAIVVLMIYSLLREGYPRFQSSRRMIFRLILLTINTGLWTAVFAIVDLVLIVPYPHELYYCAIDFPLTSLYLNSLLANLNSRDYVRRAAGDVERSTYAMADTFRATHGMGATQSHGIHIQTTTDTTIYGDSALGAKAAKI